MEPYSKQTDFHLSIIIPVLNAEKYLPELLSRIVDQKDVDIREIILIDSRSTDGTLRIAESCELVKILEIDDFSHGRARNMGVDLAGGDVVVFLSQDALPLDASWAYNLVEPLYEDGVVASFSRQIPRSDANPMEQFFLATHFPAKDPKHMGAEEDANPSFQKGIFFSNVSSAIRRSIAQKYPFDEKIIMSEDQQFARDVVKAGYNIVYQPSSKVVHSHNYTLSTVFKRYFDSVYSLRGLFDDHDIRASVSIGAKYIFKELGFIIRFHAVWLPYYFMYSSAKIFATLLAHTAEMLPNWFLRRISLHSYYWDEVENESGN